MQSVSLELLRTASASFSFGNRTYGGSASSQQSLQYSNSAGTIPSISVISHKASISSNAIVKIIDIIGTMRRPSHQFNGAGNENLTGAPAFDIIRGSDTDDTLIYVNSRNNYGEADLHGGGGDDVISISSVGDGPHVGYGGDGNDTISVSSRHAGAFGGDGDDVIAVAGAIAVAYGDAGDDVISATGNVVARVRGGQGNDTITINGDSVGLIDGGTGDDVITVTSDNDFDDWNNYDHRFSQGHGGDGYDNPATIDGGKGNDIINIDGKARVLHRAGDGQDDITVTDTTEFATFGDDWFDGVLSLDEATFSYENDELTVTFEGRDDKMTIRAAGGELSWEITSDRTFMVTVNKTAEISVDVEASASVEVEQDGQTDS